MHVALVTGRSYPFARPVAEGLPDSLTLIVSNGAVERGMDGSTRAPASARQKCRAHGARCQRRRIAPSAALVFDRDSHGQIVFETMDWTHPGRKGYWARNKSLIARSVPLEDALVEDPIQVMFNGGFMAMRALVEVIRAQAHAVDRVAHRVRASATSRWSTSPVRTATKGHALASWRAALGLEREQVMAIGDNFNDLEMLEFAGTPVVMGNAVATAENARLS